VTAVYAASSCCGSIGEIIDLVLSFVRDDSACIQQAALARTSLVNRSWQVLAERHLYEQVVVDANSRHHLCRTLCGRPELGPRVVRLHDCTPAAGASFGHEFGLPLLADLLSLLPNLTSLSCSGSYGQTTISSVLAILPPATVLNDITVIDAIDRDVLFLGTLPHLRKLTLRNFRDMIPREWTDELPTARLSSAAPLRELDVHLGQIEVVDGALNGVGWLAEHTSNTIEALTLRQVSAKMARNVCLISLRRLRKLDFQRSERWSRSEGSVERADSSDSNSDTDLDAFLGHLGRTTPVVTLDYHLCPEVDAAAQLIAVADRFGDLGYVQDIEVHPPTVLVGDGLAEQRLIYECYARLTAEQRFEPDPEGCVAHLRRMA
jgi:hypothetical protein